MSIIPGERSSRTSDANVRVTFSSPARCRIDFNFMATAIKQQVRVEAGGRVAVQSSELREGESAEVTDPICCSKKDPPSLFPSRVC